MGIFVYGLLALALVSAIGGAIYGLDHRGYVRGAAEKQHEWDDANSEAVKEKEAQLARERQLSQAGGARLQTELQKQKALNRDLASSVAAHIKAADFNQSCRLTDSLLIDWNIANRGPAQGDAGGSLPDASRKPASADGRLNGGAGDKPSVGN